MLFEARSVYGLAECFARVVNTDMVLLRRSATNTNSTPAAMPIVYGDGGNVDPCVSIANERAPDRRP